MGLSLRFMSGLAFMFMGAAHAGDPAAVECERAGGNNSMVMTLTRNDNGTYQITYNGPPSLPYIDLHSNFRASGFVVEGAADCEFRGGEPTVLRCLGQGQIKSVFEVTLHGDTRMSIDQNIRTRVWTATYARGKADTTPVRTVSVTDRRTGERQTRTFSNHFTIPDMTCTHK